MGRLFILDFDEIQPFDCIYCHTCKLRVAFVEDYIGFVNDVMPEGIFNKMFNVQVEDERFHVKDGDTLADTYCVRCETLLGWKLIGVTQPCRFSKEGRFVMKLDTLSYWDDELLYELAPNDQDGNANEQVPDEQDLGANEQNANQDGGVNEQVPNQDEDIAEGMGNIDQSPNI